MAEQVVGKRGETVIQTPSPDASGKSSQTLRFHLKGVDVHFHDDANKLKAAVPVADYHIGLRHAQSMQEWSFVDHKFNTLLSFQPYLDGGIAECFVRLEPIKVGLMLSGMLNIKK